jgi:hypothetical protein
MILMAFVYAVGLFFYARQYKRLRNYYFSDTSSAKVIEDYLALLKRTIKLEELAALYTYPFAASAVFMLGFFEESEGGLQELEAYQILIILGVLIAIITPLSHLLTKWLNRLAFKKSIIQFEERLKELQSETDN